MPQPRQHPRPSLPKTLTSALLALSVVASSLLAVAIAAALPIALSEPTPAAAQVTTTEINIDLKDDDKLSTDSGIGITHTVTPSNCDTSVTEPPPQSNETANSSLADEDAASNMIYRHHIDFRCDWTITFAAADGRDVYILPHDRGPSGSRIQGGSFRSAYVTFNTIKLFKNPDRADTSGTADARRANQRLVADTANKDHSTVHVLQLSKNYTILDIEEYTEYNSQITQSLSDLGIVNYLLRATNCTGASPADQRKNHALAHPDNSKISRHFLDATCQWEVAFTPKDGHCFVIWLGERDEPNDLDTIHGVTSNFFTLDKAQFPPRLALKVRNEIGFITNKTVNVLNMKVVPEANAQCVSPLRLSIIQGTAVQAGVNVAVKPVLRGSERPCTPNSHSSNSEDGNLAQLLRQDSTAAVRYELGRNCDWLVTFGSQKPNCHASAQFYNNHDAVITVTQRIKFNDIDDAELVVRALPGKSATIRLYGRDGALDFRPEGNELDRPNNPRIHHIGYIRFRACDGPVRTGRLFIDKVPVTGDTLEVQDFSYSIKATECDGVNLPPTQTHTETVVGFETRIVTDGVLRADPANRITHWMHYNCRWNLSFATPEHCEVKAVVKFEDSTAAEVTTTKGSLRLYPRGGTFRVSDEDFTAAGVAKHDRTPVKSISLTTASADGKCASDIALRNISDAGAGKQVKTEVTSSSCASPTTPHARGAGPPGNVFLQAEESSSVRLARNCAWTLTITASNPNCVASAQVLDAHGNNFGPAQTASFSDREVEVELAKTNEGLTYSYTPSGASTPITKIVEAVEFDGCVAGETPPNSVQFTVTDKTPTVDFTYELDAGTCSTGSATDQTRAHAITTTSQTASQGVHYLDYRCAWDLDVTASDACGFTLIAKDANGATLGSAVTSAVTAVSGSTTEMESTGSVSFTSDATANANRLLYGAGNVVASVEVAADLSAAGCVLPVEFVNRSAPSGFNVVRLPGSTALPDVSSDGSFPREISVSELPGAELPLPRIGASLTPLTSAGATCAADATGATKPSEAVLLDAMEFVTTGEGAARKLVLDDQGDYQFTPNSASYRLDKTCYWRVEFVSEVGDEDELCFSAAWVLGRDGKQLGHAVLAAPYDGDLIDDNDTPDDSSDDVVVRRAVWRRVLCAG